MKLDKYDIIKGYQKIGDIAKQIEVLRETDATRITHVVGGIKIESKEELEQLIAFQWYRIDFLIEFIKSSNEKKEYILKNLKESLKECEGCAKLGQLKEVNCCSKHLLNFSFIQLVNLLK